MAADDKGSGENAVMKTDREPIIVRPQSIAEVEKAVGQHYERIVSAVLDGCRMIEWTVTEAPEPNKSRGLRILADTWRHYTPEEKAIQLLAFWANVDQTAKELLAAHFAAPDIHSQPPSGAKN